LPNGSTACVNTALLRDVFTKDFAHSASPSARLVNRDESRSDARRSLGKRRFGRSPRPMAPGGGDPRRGRSQQRSAG
jgi:hypothetical protein